MILFKCHRRRARTLTGAARCRLGLSGIVLSAALLTACGGGSSSAIQEPGIVGDGELSVVLETARSSHDLPALAAVLIEDGAIVEMGAVGRRVFDEPESVTEEDQWHLGSISKSMTSTLTAVLIERGVLDWDTTVGDVLLIDVPDMRDEYRGVRIEELMAQTGGLPVDITQAPAFLSGDVNDTSLLPMSERRLVWSADLLRIRPEAAVGRHLYSNANYIVLGTILEKVTGEPWEDLMQRELFAPLGMQDSGFGPPGVAGTRAQPWGHAANGSSWQAFDPGRDDADNALALGPAGTVHSTLRDGAAYMAAHLAGAQGSDNLLKAATFRRLHTAQPGTGYAGGWVVAGNGWAGRPSFWHNGSNGRWFAQVVISPERNAAVMVVTNGNSRDAVEEFVNVMIRRFESNRG